MNRPHLPHCSFDDVRARVADWTDDASAPLPVRGSHSLERLRAAARTQVEFTTIARAATSVGMSRKSLRNFLDGGPIRPSTRGKMFKWLVRNAAEVDEHASQCAQMLLALVVELPVEEQVAAVYVLVEKLRDEFQQRTGKVPAWLGVLIEVVSPLAPDTGPDPDPTRSGPGSGN